MKPIIRETKNYKIFELFEVNRDIRKIEKLKKSMEKYGWIHAYPMHVVRADGPHSLLIKDGHHRFFVATSLGIPVEYVVCDDSAEIYELAQSANKWSVPDFVTAYARSGNENYEKLLAYSHNTGIAPSMAASMLMGHQASSGNAQGPLTRGTFKISQTANHAEIVKRIVLRMKECGIPWASSRPCVCAISKVVFVPEFDIRRFLEKIKSSGATFQQKRSSKEMVEEIEKIYNRGVIHRKRIPLSFYAERSSSERNPAK